MTTDGIVLVERAQRFGERLEIARDDRVIGRVQLDAAQRRAEAADQLVRELGACRGVDHDLHRPYRRRARRAGPTRPLLAARAAPRACRSARSALGDRPAELRGAERRPPLAAVERLLQQIDRLLGLECAERFDRPQIHASAAGPCDRFFGRCTRTAEWRARFSSRRAPWSAPRASDRCRWRARAAARHTPPPCRSREWRAPPRAARAARCRRAASSGRGAPPCRRTRGADGSPCGARPGSPTRAAVRRRSVRLRRIPAESA